MGYQSLQQGSGTGTGNTGTTGSISTSATSSPRFSGHQMTRRTHSFKRSPRADVELQIGSPRSPLAETTVNLSNESSLDAPSGNHQYQYQHQPGVKSRFGVFRKHGGTDKKIGNFALLFFCGFCFVLGSLIFFAGCCFCGAFVPLRQTFEFKDLGTSDSNNLEFKAPQNKGHSGVGDSERTLMTVESEMQVHNSEFSSGTWAQPLAQNFIPCIYTSSHKKLDPKTNGYVLMNANGGLNQMRFGICDMVAVAKIIKATFVLPSLDHTSYWADDSCATLYIAPKVFEWIQSFKQTQ